MKQIELLKITTARVVDNLFAGDYFSIFKGRGTEFLEVREYSPDHDDIREIDWNVTARTGVVHVKKFREERDLAAMLVIDLSGSMDYGSSETKKEKVLELAGLVGMSVVKRNNRLGFIAFTDRIEAFHRPKSGRKQFYRLLETLETIVPEGKGTNMGKALEMLNIMPGRGTVVFLISDFLSDGYEKALKIAARRFDLVPVVVSDPTEEDIPDLGIVRLMDRESGEEVLFDTSDSEFRRLYLAERRRRKAYIGELFRSAGLEEITIKTDRPVLTPVKEFFYRRERVRTAGRGA